MVPRGTVIREVTSGTIMADMSTDEPFIAAKGGKGGWGNSHFGTGIDFTLLLCVV